MNRRLLALTITLSSVAVAEIVFPGCATGQNGQTQTIRIHAEPADAVVSVNGVPVKNKVDVRTTHKGSVENADYGAVNIHRWSRPRIEVSRPGYAPWTGHFTPSLDGQKIFGIGGNWWNLGIGFPIDLLNPGGYQLQPPRLGIDKKSGAEIRVKPSLDWPYTDWNDMTVKLAPQSEALPPQNKRSTH
jgi:hypothetical protein